MVTVPTRRVEQEPDGSIMIYSAAKALGKYWLVVIEPDGQVDYASCLDLTHPGRLIGLALDVAARGDRVSVKRAGEVTEPSWDWQADHPLWLGKDGELTQVRPNLGFLCQVGVALSPQSILLFDVGTAHVTYFSTDPIDI